MSKVLTSKDILPCPICGCMPEPIKHTKAGRYWDSLDGSYRDRGQETFSITCRSSAENLRFGHLVTVTRNTEHETIDAWNTRHNPLKS